MQTIIHLLGNPRMNQRARAHETRLDGSVERGPRHPVVAQLTRRLAKSEHLGMRGGISGTDQLVEASTNNPALVNHDRPNGHLTTLQRTFSLMERLTHPVFMRGRRRRASHT